MARILIVDDDVELSADTAACLAAHGHRVSTLDDHEKAVDHLLTNTPDLLILDVMFPDNPTAGLDVARRIRHRKEIRHLPILMLTGVNQEFPTDFSSGDIDPEWMPVQDFAEKPIRPELLIEKVSALLRGSAPSQ